MHPLAAGLISSSNSTDGVRRALARECERKVLVRVRRGYYFDRALWLGLPARDKHIVRVLAAASWHPALIFSHWSAAAITGLPIVGAWPDEVHVVAPQAAGGRSGTDVRRHCSTLADNDVDASSVPIHTSIERTLLDLAVTQPFRYALAPIDHSLTQSLTSLSALDAAAADAPARGRARAQRAFAHGSALSGSPGESLSRGTMIEFGFPHPVLQPKYTVAGKVYFPDFEWPDFRQFGEFDGHGKYLRENLRAGQSSGAVVVAEKWREDALRHATGNRFTRWGWDAALRAIPLRDLLIAAGLPCSRPLARL